jgi:acetolactate synthase-1/2/3 large subunit
VLRGLLERTSGDAAPRPTLRALAGGVERQVLPSSMRFDRMAAHDAVRELQAVLPADTIFTIDSGEHYLFAAHYLETSLPDTFVAMTGLGSMGQSLGTAIGSQLAFPGRRVAAICGDGCFAMNAFEIATAVAERLPIRVFVFNDERLGMVENGHISLYGRTPAYPTTPLDVCTVAKGLGATARRVERPGQLTALADVLTREPGPVVIDVCIDPEIKLARRVRVNAMPVSDHPRH